MGHQTYATDAWRVILPAGWQHLRTTPEGVEYFESTDQHQGLYIAVWNIGGTPRPAAEVVHEFMQTECDNLNAMPDHAWQHAPHTTAAGEALLDSLEPTRHYRILCSLIARPPRVLRASFHDYDCRDLAASNAVLGPLLESVELSA